ncbi:MAG TPA: HEAT repeat domain-containing protein [Nitrospira sp.]|nr:HEAT repeat domain-containing protein [Nitrospira sp.]
MTSMTRAALILLLFSIGAGSAPPDLKTLYDQKQYQGVLDGISKLTPEVQTSVDVRRLKVQALIKLGNPQPALVEYDQLEAAQRRDDIPLLRELALGFILALVKDMREQMRGAAYTALKEVNSDETIPYFEDGLSDGSGPVRVLAVEGLGRSEKGRKSKKLRLALDDQAGMVKARAVKVLGKSGDRSVLPLIEQATKDELPTVRIAAFGALIRLGRTEAWKALRKAADAPNPEDRAEALRIMADLNDQRAAPLMKGLLDYNQPSVRAAAARGLGHLHRRDAREDIEKLLNDPVAPVRESAAAALADLGAKDAVPALTRKLSDGAFSVRAAAAAALLQLGEPFETVGPTLLALAQHNDPASRSSAAFAMGKASAPNRLGAISLLSALAQDPLPGPKTVALRSLGHIGSGDLVPDLKASLHDQNEAVRATAAGALLHVLSPQKGAPGAKLQPVDTTH